MDLPDPYLDQLALTALPDRVFMGVNLLEQVKAGDAVSEVLESLEAGLDSALRRGVLVFEEKHGQRSSPGGGQANMN
jgi:hypothetical protein